MEGIDVLGDVTSVTSNTGIRVLVPRSRETRQRAFTKSDLHMLGSSCHHCGRRHKRRTPRRFDPEIPGIPNDGPIERPNGEGAPTEPGDRIGGVPISNGLEATLCLTTDDQILR